MQNSTNYDKVIAIILASGKGVRFGMPKAEADWGGKTFISRINETLLQAGIKRIHNAIGYSTVDMLATLKQAVRELEMSAMPGCTGYLVFPVDFPMVQCQTLITLLEEHQKKPQAVVRPCYYGFSGHPIIIPVGLNLDADARGKGLRGIILHSGLPICDVQVEDEGIHRNINRPEDLP